MQTSSIMLQNTIMRNRMWKVRDINNKKEENAITIWATWSCSQFSYLCPCEVVHDIHMTRKTQILSKALNNYRFWRHSLHHITIMHEMAVTIVLLLYHYNVSQKISLGNKIYVSCPGHAVKWFWGEQYFYSTNGRTLAKLSLLLKAYWASDMEIQVAVCQTTCISMDFRTAVL